MGVFVSSNHLLFKDGTLMNINTGRVQKYSYKIGRCGKRYLKAYIGQKHRPMVHRLMIYSFTGQDISKLEVDHKDFNTENCSLDNLQAVTPQKNKLLRDIKRDFEVMYKRDCKIVRFK